MRLSRGLLALVLAALVAACGSPAATTDGGDGNGNGGDGSQESEPAATSGDGGDSGGDDGDSGSGSLDVDRVFEILTPENATELSKTTAGGLIFAAWDSDESFESLRSFYEDAIDEAGLQIFSTTEAQGGIAWAIAEDESGGFGGTVSLFPASDGSGTQISVTVGESN
jgi:hypothetical protein